MIVEYASGRDRWNSFWLRLTDGEYRNQFRELKRSNETYVLNFNKNGNNSFTTDGSKLFINYSLTDAAKAAGQTRYSLLKHEFEHGVQFEHGEIEFRSTELGWGTVDRDGNYYPMTSNKWTPSNYDRHDELKAHDAGARAPQFRSDNDRGRWLFEYDANGIRQNVPDPVRLQRIQNTPEYQRLPLGPLNNSNTERIKNYYQYALPYKLRLY